MFMTFKCGSQENATEMHDVHATDRMGRPNNTSHVACNSCRKKKLRCSREKVGCRRCQQRGTRCVYDTQKSRGGSNNKRHEVTSAEAERPEITGGDNGSDQQPETVAQGSGHPWDDDDSSCIQVAVPSIAPAPTQQSQGQAVSSSSDVGSRNDSGTTTTTKGSSSDRSNREIARQSGPQIQQDSFQQVVSQTGAVEQNTQTIATCPEDSDTGFFLDFAEEYLNNTHGGFVELLDPFDPDGLLSHNHMPVENSSNPTLTQVGNFNNKERGSGGSSRAFSYDSSQYQALAPLDQPMRTSSSKSSSVSYSKSSSVSYSKSSSASYSKSNVSDSNRTPSSGSSRNGMDIDTDSYEDSSNSYDDGDCECMDMALQILEEVVIPPVGADWAMAENTMFLLKNNISRCLVLSQCRGCRQESGICMLTLVIYEKLMTGFEEVAQWWSKQGHPQGARGDSRSRRERHHQPQQQQQKEQQQQPQQHQRSSGSKQLQQKTRITMGKYQIDTAEEHRAVFATIITCQLQRLAGLSLLMMQHSKKAKWLAHVQYGEGLRLRIKKLEKTWKC
ncbi:hypothetical protein COCC4DRAFT_78227 [Bipolaris maydis ATCC 48331]|uniref:Zn(2)-C6 fungal-type domain-containing protein n=2 Tax=Cochliobolus heterostrophus TaxID=5016 RepID=M2TWA3_COCH5|nr:uncharacterized protein COCC4DRAFT_78227 [Bipolaris maydis ATCC 48331]EMD90789.1 hypothetical protein COCHEDRAFT_1205203 [Bipolaris maydis C5]KAJ5023433.1 hypothetical protein J3E73DRAFT_433357 [Bipolaris maydis]ENI09000.1 hypothetical protein COCC4DRAFT_78227 [Bipolaris maydis ATCC 48331]KAJ6206668.1 hypothetical protein PSV09DRAFT_1205203 [Bipolaris maydis]KAJ6269360.1 hypothetical protein PSV08DRAFT_411168 [Bipolaris maydis]